MDCHNDLPVTATLADVANVATTAIANDVMTFRGAGNDAINAVIITFPSRTVAGPRLVMVVWDSIVDI